MRYRPFLLKLLIVWIFVFTVPPTLAQTENQVWALYMGFWAGQQSWDWQTDVLSDTSVLGAYDSRNPVTADTHIQQAQATGITGFVVTWFGVNDGQTTTPALNILLDQAAKQGFQIGAAIDVFNQDFNRSRDAIVNSLNWLVQDRMNHPAYLRYQGKPVIFFIFQERTGFDDATWLDIRNQIDPERNTLWIAEGVDGCCLYNGAMDGMYAFNLAWANGSGSEYANQRNSVGNAIYIPTIHPGWDESKVAARDGRANPTSPRDRAGGGFLQNSWDGALSINPDVILINSWNEFVENSHIEPSNLFGTQALDTLRPLITAWRGNTPSPAQSAPAISESAPPPSQSTSTNSGGSGQFIEPTVRLNVRAGDNTDSEILGQIDLGNRYEVLGQESGWYIINYNGQRAYIFAEYTRSATALSAPPPPQSVNTSPQSGNATLRPNVVLRVRIGPDTATDTLGMISPEKDYSIVDNLGNWYSIQYEDWIGYVAAEFVTVSGTLPPAQTIAPSANNSNKFVEAIYILNVRSGPGTEYEQIAYIEPGTSYRVLSEENGWFGIDYLGQTAYVSAEFVEVEEQ